MLKRMVPQKWRLTAQVLPLVVLVVGIKLVVHAMGLEFLPLSTLFTAIISANIFLIGFLISGVLADYKESEKLPGELASSLETMADEAIIIFKAKRDGAALRYLADLETFSHTVDRWFHKRERTTTVMHALTDFNDHFRAFESLTQANFIARMKQEQASIRRMLNRIHTIRETSFNAAGYAIAEGITFLLSVGMVFLTIEPYYASIFFVAFVSFVLLYMVMLIHDLDNPFGYYEKAALSEEVSLKPLHDVQRRLADIRRSLTESAKDMAQ